MPEPITCQLLSCRNPAMSDAAYCAIHRQEGEDIDAGFAQALEMGLIEVDGINEDGKIVFRRTSLQLDEQPPP